MKKIRLIFMMLFCVLGLGPGRAQELPNIILLYTDDLGYGNLSCYNESSVYFAPNLDSLAEEEVVQITNLCHHTKTIY